MSTRRLMTTTTTTRPTRDSSSAITGDLWRGAIDHVFQDGGVPFEIVSRRNDRRIFAQLVQSFGGD
jgi:hypothetical protein